MPVTKPQYSNEGYMNLFSLALSDYVLWADLDLCRALDFCLEPDEEGAGGFFLLTQLLKRSKALAPLTLENVQVQIVKALCAEGKVDVRLLVSEPSASTWGGQTHDGRDLGAYEIHRWETAGESKSNVSPPPLPPADSDTHGINLKSDAVHSTSMQYWLFGHSYDSASSKPDSAPHHSKEGLFSASASPVIAEYKKGKNSNKDKGDKEKEKDRDSLGSPRLRSKKSTDSAGKGTGERLSIFRITFSGTLGKGRKPPPRYPATQQRYQCKTQQEHSEITLPWLTSSSHKAPKHDRPPSTSTTGTTTPTSTPKPTPKSIYKEAPVSSALS
ncbi:hypothetical protein DXG01_002782 [Tephrocybe rancida]|nr:hypothetical protein DXG01_002782 [Tephrocybe rancida]